MDHRDDVESAGLDGCRGQRAAKRVGIARAAPLHVEPRHHRAISLAHLREPIAEVAGDDDEDAGAFAHEVRDHCFHPRRARS